MSRRGLLLLLAGLLALAFSNRSSAAGSPLFQPPRSPAVPAVRNKAWCVNPIDAFVLAAWKPPAWNHRRPPTSCACCAASRST